MASRCIFRQWASEAITDELHFQAKGPLGAGSVRKRPQLNAPACLILDLASWESCSHSPVHTTELLWPGMAMIITVIVNHPLHVSLCPAHLLLCETTLGPFQPALYVQTT